MVFIAIASAVFNGPVLIGLLLIVFFASIGISLGVRRAYIKVLLKIFEVCGTKNKTPFNPIYRISFDIQSRFVGLYKMFGVAYKQFIHYIRSYIYKIASSEMT